MGLLAFCRTRKDSEGDGPRARSSDRFGATTWQSAAAREPSHLFKLMIDGMPSKRLGPDLEQPVS